MKFSTVIAVMGSADALTLNQMAEIYKQVYQRPANDLFTMVEDVDANATGLANTSANLSANASANATANATATATSFA